MTKPAAFQGQCVDMRNVSSHKSFRLYIDFPAEAAQSIIDALGWATGANPVPLAVALLDLAKTAKPDPVRRDAAKASARKTWDNMPASQQAGIRCNEVLFSRFMGEQTKRSLDGPDDVADAIRAHCNVKSRSEFSTNPDALAKWKALDDAFWFWQREVAA